MAKASNVWKLIVLSVIISLVVLAVFTAVFITMIVPAYNITRDQVYSVLSKALPILIGLILVEIGLLIGKKNEPENNDTLDKLTPNSYDSWLYTEPVDDPMAKSVDANAAFGVKEKEVIREVQVEKEVPVEVIKEVPVEIIKEVEKPVEVKVPVEVIKEVQVPVEVIKEVPVEIVKEVIKEVPVAVAEEKLFSFKEALAEEIKVANEENYPLSLVGFGATDNLDAKIERALGTNTLYFTEDGITFAILPFYEEDDANYATRRFEKKRVATVKDGKKATVDSMIAQASRGLA